MIQKKKLKVCKIITNKEKVTAKYTGVILKRSTTSKYSQIRTNSKLNFDIVT